MVVSHDTEASELVGKLWSPFVESFSTLITSPSSHKYSGMHRTRQWQAAFASLSLPPARHGYAAGAAACICAAGATGFSACATDPDPRDAMLAGPGADQRAAVETKAQKQVRLVQQAKLALKAKKKRTWWGSATCRPRAKRTRGRSFTTHAQT